MLRLPFVMLLLLGTAPFAATQTKPDSEMQRAVQEFVRQTRALGMRQDSAAARRTVRRPEWHGRLFENFRNDALDAIPHEIRQRGQRNSLLRRNQFGFNIGGPLMLPHLLKQSSKVFFSLSYEGVSEHISRTYLQTIPTMAERIGDFSSTVDSAGDPLAIYDPQSTRTNPAFDPAQAVSPSNLQYLREIFPASRIPPSRLDATAQAALAFYPEPNTSAGPFFQNNFFINSPETNDANGVIAKLDAPVGSAQHLSLEIDFSNGLLGASRWFQTDANPGPADRNFQSRAGILQDVLTVSPGTVQTFTVQARSSVSKAGADQTIFPRYSLGSYLGMGRGTPYSSAARNTYDFSWGVSARRSKHTLQVNAAYNLNQVNVYVPQYPAGYFRFTSGITSLPGIVNTGFGFASFLLGMADYAERSVVDDPSYFRQNTPRLSLSDQYQAVKNLTVTVGINMAVQNPRVEKYNRQSNIDLRAINPANGVPGALVGAAQSGATRGFRPAIATFDPRVSIAWNPGSQSDTVIRAAWSQGHSGIPIYSNQWGTQAFHARQTFLSANSQLEPALTLIQGIPPLGYSLPNLSPSVANDSVADLLDTSHRLPLVQSASFSIGRQLPRSLVASLSYSHTYGRDLLAGNGTANPNAIPASALQYGNQLYTESFNASLRPYPQFKGFDLNSSYPLARYQRDAASVSIEKRASGGLSMNAICTFSKQMDDYSGPWGTQDFYNRANEWALTAWNRPLDFQMNYVYELPMGKNKALFRYSDWRRFLVENWSVSGTAYLGVGTPLALHPAFNNTGGVLSTLNVNVVPGVDPHVANPGPAQWFNPAAFDQPEDFTMGNASRTLPGLSNPGVHSFDLSVSKRFSISAERTLELSVEAFDALNHADWNQPDPIIGPASAPNLNAGKIIGSHGGRVIQVGARVSF